MCLYNSKNATQQQTDRAYQQQQSGGQVRDLSKTGNGGAGIFNKGIADPISYAATTEGRKANTPADGAGALTPGASTQRRPTLLGSDPGQANTAAPSNRRRGIGRAGMGSTSTDALGQNTLLGG